jgi:hypothetical protein
MAFLLIGLLAVLRFAPEPFLQKYGLDGFDKIVLFVVLAIYALIGALSIYENKRTNGLGWVQALLGSIALLLTFLVGFLRLAPEAFLQKYGLDGFDKAVLLVLLAIYALMAAPSIYGARKTELRGVKIKILPKNEA